MEGWKRLGRSTIAGTRRGRMKERSGIVEWARSSIFVATRGVAFVEPTLLRSRSSLVLPIDPSNRVSRIEEIYNFAWTILRKEFWEKNSKDSYVSSVEIIGLEIRDNVIL